MRHAFVGIIAVVVGLSACTPGSSSGEVTSSDGSTVATFEFPPDFEFSEDSSANEYRPATSTIPDVDAIAVEPDGGSVVELNLGEVSGQT